MSAERDRGLEAVAATRHLLPRPSLAATVFVAASVAVLTAATPASASASEPSEAYLLDVPFLPQPPVLCGGAAVAMVLRYWGESGVYAEDFRPHVDDELRGITTADLTEAVRSRGWRVFPVRATPDAVRRHLARGRPLVLLLNEGASGPGHYVVALGWARDRIVLHDPSVGPLRSVAPERLFEPEGELWSLLILPGAPVGEEPLAESAPLRPPTRRDGTVCRPLVTRAVSRGGEEARSLLRSAARICPDDGTIPRELAALEFRAERWTEAASLAERAVRLDPADEHAWSLLGASRFLAGERRAALRAWNAIGRPRVDRVEIRGLARTRQEVVYRHLGLEPGEALLSSAFERASRRAGELPTIDRARVAFEPLGDGEARVVAALSEGPLVGSVRTLVARGAIDAAIDRTSSLELRSPVGGGELLEVESRWWKERPALRVSLSSPRMLGLPGIVTLTGFAERQAYAPPGSSFVLEERRGAGLQMSDWLTPDARLSIGLGLDHFRSRGSWVSLRAALDQRLFDDRLALGASVSRWMAAGRDRPFDELGASARGRLPLGSESYHLSARLDAIAVSPEAPLGLWPGAGTGRARPLLLRGYPLLAHGVVSGAAFSPRLVHASVELERTAMRSGLVRIGVAGFFDWARASGRPDAPPASYASVGAGGRLHVWGRTLRLDAAVRPADGRTVFSAGWVESW